MKIKLQVERPYIPVDSAPPILFRILDLEELKRGFFAVGHFAVKRKLVSVSFGEIRLG